MPVVELLDVSRSFDGGRITALQAVTLSVAENETLAIVGRSGSGKSTLLNMMCGLDRPTGGTVRFLGEPVRDKAQWTAIRAQHCGIVFQNFCLIPSLTAEQNVALAVPDGSAAARRLRARAMLERVGLEDRAQQLPNRLSGGERQRVAIARALVNRPSLVLADEPTGSLDRDTSASVLALLEAMRAESRAALVMVTHEAAIAAACDRRITVADGALAAGPA